MSGPDLLDFQARALSDTGVFGREVLGYNYDEDEGGRRINVGTGGLRDSGKTKEFVQLLDNRDLEYKLGLMPRESRKSTALVAFCTRQICANPNIRIFYGARTQAMVEEKVLAIRNHLERDEITALFGAQKGPLWEADRFTVAGRTAVLLNPTVQTFSFDAVPHGGRADIVILDDFIDETNCTNTEQLEKAKEKWRAIQPLVAKGGQIVVVGTVWDDEDLYAELEGNPLFAPPHGGQVVCGAGVTPFYNATDATLDLCEDEGGITFPHLTVPYLRKKLWGMMQKGKTAVHFVRQYLNIRLVDSLTSFHREDFRAVQWSPDMEQLTGYLLTDTATSKQKEGCYSVIAYVGLDALDHIYLLDLRVGRWSQDEFIGEFFGVLETWQNRVNHAGEAWEGVQLAEVYMDSVMSNSRSRKVRVNPILMKRTAQNGSKPTRILRMQPAMRNKRFWVVDTVPRTFEDMDGTQELYNAVGYFDARSGRYLPSGHLVDSFVRPAAKKDVADTLAMILEYENVKGRKPQRYCQFKTYRPKPLAVPLTEHRKSAYHRAEYRDEPAETDWWQRTLNDNGF